MQNRYCKGGSRGGPISRDSAFDTGSQGNPQAAWKTVGATEAGAIYESRCG